MPAPLLYRDGFVRSNTQGNGLALSPSSGTVWATSGVQSLDWRVLNNQAVCGVTASYGSGGIEQFIPFAPYGITLADLTVVAAVNSLKDFALVARGANLLTTTPDYYRARMINNVSSPWALCIEKVLTGGGPTLLSSISMLSSAFVAGADLRFDLVGSNLQVWYNTTLYLTVSDASLPSGRCGLLCNSPSAAVSRFDLRAEEIWPFVPNEYDINPELLVEEVEYDSGFVQRNRIWSRERYSWTHKYLTMSDTDVQTVEKFWLKYSSAMTVLYLDPISVFSTPTQKIFAIGDGATTAFKVQHDRLTAGILVYKNGSLDATPAVSLMDGLILYSTPPQPGDVLAYTPSSGSGYRARMKSAPKIHRKPPGYWDISIDWEQEKLMYAGVPV